MTTGWRYSAQIPDFTKEERHGEEIVVYYQVDVLVQAPGATEPAPPTTVWRRFSEFRQLYANLKGAYPDLFKKKELEPPSKRSFRFVNNNDRLLNERRQQLEAWLWRLLSHGDIARSHYMRMFLQLNLAVRGATTEQSMADAHEEDEQLDTSSELSAPSGITHLSHAMTDVGTPGTARYSMKTESLDAYRMGMRVEQRRELKQLMKVIATSLEQISREAQEVKGDNRSLQQENRSLEEQVASLHQTIKDGTYSKDEKQEELSKALEEKETSLKRTHETIHQLEMALQESKRTTEALESELRSVKCDNAMQLEKQLGDMAVVESKMQSQSVALAKSEQQLTDTRRQARQDNRVLAEAVKTLRQEKTTLAATLKERDDQLKEFQKLREDQKQMEADGKLLRKRVKDLEQEVNTVRSSAEREVKEVNHQTQNKLQEMKERHAMEVTFMQESIEELQKTLGDIAESRDMLLIEKEAQSSQTAVSTQDGVRLVIQIQQRTEANEDQTSSVSKDEICQLQEENITLKEKLELTDVKRAELSDLKTKFRDLLEKNAALEERLKDKPLEPNGDVPNLDGLMMTIQHLQEENASLQEAASTQMASTSLKRFAEEIGSICLALQKCSMSGKRIEGPLSPEEVNAMIENMSDSNGSISELTSRTDQLKSDFLKDDALPHELVQSVVQLLTDFFQKSNEINEMMIHTYLSYGSTGSSTEGTSTSSAPLMKRLPPKVTDGHTMSPDGSSSETPSVKSFLGGIGAKMSQGSQGFMSFMQRGAIPPENDQISFSRREQQ